MIKLSVRDIKTGDKFTYYNTTYEVTGLSQNRETVNLKDINRDSYVTTSFNSLINWEREGVVKFIEPEIKKPHEYSPVEMTGRYRTIGD